VVKILTTHVGSLPGPPGFDPVAPDDATLRTAVDWVVAEQRAAGLDVINEGELTKQGNTKVVKLSTATVAYNAGTPANPDVVYNTLATPVGGQY